MEHRHQLSSATNEKKDVLHNGTLCTSSARRANSETSDPIKVLDLASRELESVLECSSSNDRVGQSKPKLTHRSPGTSGNRSIDLNLAEWGQKLRYKVGRGITGEEFRPSDH